MMVLHSYELLHQQKMPQSKLPDAIPYNRWPTNNKHNNPSVPTSIIHQQADRMLHVVWIATLE